MKVSEVPLLKSYFDDFTLLNVREKLKDSKGGNHILEATIEERS